MTTDQPSAPDVPQPEAPKSEPVFMPSTGGSYERLPDGSLKLISKTEDAPAAAPQEGA